MNSAEDGSLRVRGRNILDLRLEDGQHHSGHAGQTVRQHFASLLSGIFGQPGGTTLLAPVIEAMTAHGVITEGDTARGYQLIGEAIDVLAVEPFRPIGMKTDTEKRLAQLQRRNPGKRR